MKNLIKFFNAAPTTGTKVDEQLVLDFFAGSGTTGAACMKMGRRFIMVENLPQHIDIIKRRLDKVIAGEQSGISKKYNWAGGGEYKYIKI